MEFRKDIQILRGIAVLLVVLFHLGVAGFNSGFLGVDVFFVISGYLMAIMYNPHKKKEFFYKRAKRLLPAYFVTIGATLIASVVTVTPNDFWEVSRQSRFATLFSSNIGYWMENSYFDKSTFKPLLHLWSLGVEIQFYILVPFLVWLFLKLRPMYALIGTASAILCFFVVSVSPSSSFFLLPFRLWEFLVGFGVAKYIYNPMNGRFRSAKFAGALSMFLIVAIPFIKIDGQATGFIFGHPGLIALLICAATAGVLSFGVPEFMESNLVAKGLIRIGEYSYSIYLAHFPVVVLFLYQPFSGTSIKSKSLSEMLLLSILIAVSSVILYLLVEKPFRNSTCSPLRMVATSVVMVFVLGGAGLVTQRFIYSEQDFLVFDAWLDRDEFRCGKFFALVNRGVVSCEITRPVANPKHRMLLVGNSHADSIKRAFADMAELHGSSVYFIVNNNPLMPGSKIGSQVVVDEAIRKNVDAIVFHYSPSAIKSIDIARVANLLKGSGIKIAFIMPVPVWDKHVPLALWNNAKNDEELPVQDVSDYMEFNKGLVEGLKEINYDRFTVYRVSDILCRTECLLAADNGRPLYFDTGHLTLTGSRILNPVFDEIISDISRMSRQ